MLLTPKEVARRLNVSPRTVYLWLEQGRLPAVRLSQRVTRVPEEAVVALVESMTTAATDTALMARESSATYCPTCGAPNLVVADTTPSQRIMDAVRQHRDEILEIADRRRAENVRIFGSVARGDAREDSDLDILVDLKPHASLFDLGGLNGELETLLGMKVDVVPANSVKAPIRERVMSEAVPL